MNVNQGKSEMGGQAWWTLDDDHRVPDWVACPSTDVGVQWWHNHIIIMGQSPFKMTAVVDTLSRGKTRMVSSEWNSADEW